MVAARCTSGDRTSARGRWPRPGAGAHETPLAPRGRENRRPLGSGGRVSGYRSAGWGDGSPGQASRLSYSVEGATGAQTGAAAELRASELAILQPIPRGGAKLPKPRAQVRFLSGASRASPRARPNGRATLFRSIARSGSRTSEYPQPRLGWSVHVTTSRRCAGSVRSPRRSGASASRRASSPCSLRPRRRSASPVPGAR